jgi:ribosome biogenesis GTPase / thiamine phosphate phosphatase
MTSENDKKHHKLPKRWISCETEVDYFGEDRKIGKADRKKASAKDRSQYKTTDKRQLAKQQKEFTHEEHLKRGRVLSIASQGLMVEADDGKMIICQLRGSLKKEKTQFKNLVAVGDLVLFDEIHPQEGQIVHIEPRRTVLSRAENLSRRKEQLIAANIDQVMITVSVISPELKPSLVDRYIIATQKGGMTPIIVVNKIDLLNTIDDPEVEAEKELYESFQEAYQAAGIPIISLSVRTGEGIEQLKQIMKDKASVFSGQSGVGKSSLINAVTGKNLKVGALVEKTNKGTHTTTTAQLIPLEIGGWCIDTPGIKSFGVWNLDREVVEHYFPEIFECGAKCKFPDCSHLHEADCAVVTAVEKGEISWLRYESYQTLMHSLAEEHFRR